MTYFWIKQIHLYTISFNIAFFALRLYWMRCHPGWVRQRGVRVLSQVNDTILLAAGTAMVVMTHLSPLSSQWLGVKLIALVLYIVFGMMALRPGFSKKRRTFFGILALLTVGYIVTVALSRTPKSWILLGL
ncbi:MAG: SirB2 family protein [Gammaproteobacteria bacterium]|nr:SirB2 family protein [Gammaproteobacteria bacterium]